jgi:hypothetical protein
VRRAVTEGLGSRIVRLLAQQLESTVQREAAHPGHRLVLNILLLPDQTKAYDACLGRGLCITPPVFT